ncbi:MAG: YjjW family glycine radical enzyme activase [Flavonifractor plautii]
MHRVRRCVPACPAGALSLESDRVRWAAERCAGCDACIRLCPRFASPKVTVMTASEVLSALAPSRPFIRGLTVSGGECTLYPDFLTELFTLARAGGLGCLLDSNGMVPLAPLAGLMAVCDGVMLDVKAWEPAVHRALTGADNAPVKENLAFLSACGKLAEVRVVCAPDAVDVEAVLDGVAAALGPRAPSTPVKLITFRPNGVRGALAGRPSPTPEQMTAWRAYALSAGLGAVLLR